jgi:hypothetical protein
MSYNRVYFPYLIFVASDMYLRLHSFRVLRGHFSCENRFCNAINKANIYGSTPKTKCGISEKQTYYLLPLDKERELLFQNSLC